MDYSFILVLSHLQVLLQGLWFSLLIITISFGITIFKTDLHRFNTRGTTINNNKLHQLPPGPKPWPIVGNLPTMLANKPTFRWINALMKEMNTEIACIRLGNVHVIPVTSPAIAREFLRKQDATFASRPLTMSTDVISSGYLTTTVVPFGEQWKKMRRIISSSLFSTTKHQRLHAKRTEEADRLVFHVYNECNNNNVNGVVNVRDAARHYCCNVIKRLCFNRTWIGKGSRNEEVEHLEALFTLLKHIYAFSVSDYVPNCLRGLDLDGHQAKVKEALRIVNKYHDPIIEERIREWNKNNDGDYHDFLDILISLKDPNNKPTLTLHEIKAQTTELMLATVDNPSNAIEWALAEMINQPELLKRATEELDNVVGKERLVQESDIPKLKYVKACAREAFRLHPIVPFNLPHLSTKDTIVANYLIPKGSHVLLSRRELGRNPKVWNQPNRFDPERHLLNNNEVVLREPDLRFISFSTGTRGCPGIMLGTTMTIMLFARLLHGFTWTTPPNVSTINLAESHADAFLAEPLVAKAKPRLPVQLYIPAD